MNFVRVPLILGNDGSTEVDSAPIEVRFMRSMGVTLVTDDEAAEGTLTVEVSNNTNTPDDPYEWVPLPDVSATLAAGVPGIIPTTGICWEAIRFHFAPSAGNGTVKVLVKCYEI